MATPFIGLEFRLQQNRGSILCSILGRECSARALQDTIQANGSESLLFGHDTRWVNGTAPGKRAKVDFLIGPVDATVRRGKELEAAAAGAIVRSRP